MKTQRITYSFVEPIAPMCLRFVEISLWPKVCGSERIQETAKKCVSLTRVTQFSFFSLLRIFRYNRYTMNSESISIGCTYKRRENEIFCRIWTNNLRYKADFPPRSFLYKEVACERVLQFWMIHKRELQIVYWVALHKSFPIPHPWFGT